ncbi:MAG: hypothetical protein IT487_19240 [Chromatiaceae bacterium]|nr:hypothetical protein [Chromatiaceae bacterium]
MLATPLGHSRLLARPGDRRLCLLDASASALWELQASGLGPEALVDLLVARFRLPAEQARDQVMTLCADWRRAGLLDTAGETTDDWRLGTPDEPVWPASQPRPLAPGAWVLPVADRRVGVGCDDPPLRRRLLRMLAPEMVAEPVQVDHALRLDGTIADWRLLCDGTPLDQGQGWDAALVALLVALTELGCRPSERLIVLHGAGLVAPDGAGLLLVAPGGSGKTTLAAALNAAGHGLLSDDVVPVGPGGELWGLGLPLCLKPGSWPVLASRRPALAHTPTTARLGCEVRYLPARGPRPTGPIRTGVLFLSRYRPGQPPTCVPIGPEAALGGIIAAEAVLRDLTQAKLEALARWIGGTPAYRLEYPDLAQALALIAAIRARPDAQP